MDSEQSTSAPHTHRYVDDGGEMEEIVRGETKHFLRHVIDILQFQIYYGSRVALTWRGGGENLSFKCGFLIVLISHVFSKNQAAVKCESIGCVILVKMIKIADTLS
jgi:hypothetical protein